MCSGRDLYVATALKRLLSTDSVEKVGISGSKMSTLSLTSEPPRCVAFSFCVDRCSLVGGLI